MKETLFYNGTIYSLEKEGECFSAMIVKKGKIEKLFEKSPKIDSFKNAVNLNGKVVLPSFIESHTHFVSAGAQKKIGFMVSRIVGDKIEPNNIETALNLIEENVKHCQKGKLNIATNYILAGIEEKRLPTKEELDKVTSGYPLVVYTIDGHSCVVNTEGAEMLNLPKGHSGLLKGKEHDFMQGKIMETAMRGVNLSLAYEGIAKLASEAMSYGFSTVCGLEGQEDGKKDVLMLLAKMIFPALPLDMRLFPQYNSMEKTNSIFPVQKRKRVGGCGVWELDGSVGSCSAAFDFPYKNAEDNFGELYYDDDKRNEMFDAFDKKGVQISTHAIGTRAIEKALDSYTRIIENRNTLGHRIDHCEFPQKSDVERIKKLGLNVTIQPGYAYFDANFQHSYEHFLCEEVIEREIPLKTLYDAKINLCASSDCPVQEINPFLQIQGMVNFPKKKQSLSMFEALQTYTMMPSKALFEENEKGSIKVGKRADFAIYDVDPFEVAKEKINLIKPIETYLLGKKTKPLKGSMLELIFSVLFKKRKKI